MYNLCMFVYKIKKNTKKNNKCKNNTDIYLFSFSRKEREGRRGEEGWKDKEKEGGERKERRKMGGRGERCVCVCVYT